MTEYFRGDWFQTKQCGAYTPVCREYSKPPEDGGNKVSTIAPLTYCGPVHEVKSFNGFVSVSVPAQQTPMMLVWVNVKRYSTNFANKVPYITINQWKQDGWQNCYIDGRLAM